MNMIRLWSQARCWLVSVGLLITGIARAGTSLESDAAREFGQAGKTLAFVERDARRPALAAELKKLGQTIAQARNETDWDNLRQQAAQLNRRIILSHPLLNFDSLLFVERDLLYTAPGYKPTTKNGPFYDGQQSMDQCFGHNARKGGGLYLLKNFKSEVPQVLDIVQGLRVPTGANQGMLLSDGAFASPALSYDGQTILFAWASAGLEKWKKENRFNLFRVNVDGSHLARLTDGDYDDFDPCWLPDGGIVFISTRRGGFGRCHPRPVPTYTLYGMNADGSDIRCLSYHETNEWQPSVDHNGMLLYTRWDYVDRDAMIAIHPWTCYPDGRNPRAVQGNFPLPLTTLQGTKWADGRALRPLCEHGLRAIPGSDKYIGVATPHHDQSYGSLILIDPRVEDDNRMAQVKRLTPDVRFPENERGPLAYGTPWPLSESLYLCNYRETLCLLYFPDEQGVRVPIYQQKQLRPISPIPVQARGKPPVIMADASARNHEGSEPAKATIYIQNVYKTDEFGRLPANAKIKALRIVQVFPKTTELEDQPRISHFTESLVRASLGTVPVEADGSVYCEAPVGKEIYFQLLDDKGLAVQSMRSGTFVHPGEMLSCFGCHEARNNVPQTIHPPAATKRAPSKIQPELAGMPGLQPTETVNFYRLVKPVLDAQCAECHRTQGQGPNMSYQSLVQYMFGFEGHWDALHTAKKSGGSRTVPGQCGAMASELYAGGFLTGESARCPGKVRLNEQELRRVTLWLDLNSNELGAYHDEQAQRRGEWVSPRLN